MTEFFDGDYEAIQNAMPKVAKKLAQLYELNKPENMRALLKDLMHEPVEPRKEAEPFKDLEWQFQEKIGNTQAFEFYPARERPIKFKTEREKTSYYTMLKEIKDYLKENPKRHTMSVNGGYVWVDRDGATICYRKTR